MLRSLRAFPVENSASVGAPDICTLAGWIEMKIARWPAIPGDVVEIDLRNSQRIWLKNWCAGGGRAFTLTIVDGTWHLHDGFWAADNLGRVTSSSLQREAVAVYASRPDKEVLAMDLLNWRPRAR